jgi:hypothetical protein
VWIVDVNGNARQVTGFVGAAPRALTARKKGSAQKSRRGKMETEQKHYNPHLLCWAEEVLKENKRAQGLFPNFRSDHEGISVIREEFEELWDDIKDKHATQDQMAMEAIQLAAMALRFLTDCCGNPVEWRARTNLVMEKEAETYEHAQDAQGGMDEPTH